MGVALLRMSGPGALDAIGKLVSPSTGQVSLVPRRAAVHALHDWRTHTHSASGSSHESLIDSKALITYFPAPFSYTGEDVVEICTHGNRLVVQDTLASLAAVDGVCLAEAGEFTKVCERERESVC